MTRPQARPGSTHPNSAIPNGWTQPSGYRAGQAEGVGTQETQEGCGDDARLSRTAASCLPKVA